MPTFTLTASGSYQLWAAPDATGGPVTITVTTGDDAPDTKVYWSPSAPVLANMPSGQRATRGVVRTARPGAVVTTNPDRARLIIRQVDRDVIGRAVTDVLIYDSGPPDHPAIRPACEQP